MKIEIEIEMLNGANIEEVAKALLETMMGDEDNGNKKNVRLLPDTDRSRR